MKIQLCIIYYDENIFWWWFVMAQPTRRHVCRIENARTPRIYSSIQWVIRTGGWCDISRVCLTIHSHRFIDKPSPSSALSHLITCVSQPNPPPPLPAPYFFFLTRRLAERECVRDREQTVLQRPYLLFGWRRLTHRQVCWANVPWLILILIWNSVLSHVTQEWWRR